jgi:hypothetical protein
LVKNFKQGVKTCSPPYNEEKVERKEGGRTEKNKGRGERTASAPWAMNVDRGPVRRCNVPVAPVVVVVVVVVAVVAVVVVEDEGSTSVMVG